MAPVTKAESFSVLTTTLAKGRGAFAVLSLVVPDKVTLNSCARPGVQSAIQNNREVILVRITELIFY
jgi:hypothetical protein